MEKKFIVCEKMESDDLEGTIVGWGSKPTIDRDKELIESSAWKLDNYRKNPVVLLCHNYSAPPVGKCLWVKSSPQGLRFKAQFAKTERGKECYELYKDGIMNAFSVGFKPRQGGVIDNPSDVKYKGCKRVFTDVELMEISCVPVPANSDALVEYVKAGKIHTKQLQNELEFALDIIDKAPACPVEGSKFGVDNGKLPECKDCELAEACKEAAPKKEETDTIKKEDVEDLSLKAACPVADGKFGVDNGKYDECKDCKLGEACLKAKPEEKKDEEVIEKKESVEEHIKGLLPEAEDLVKAVDELFSLAEKGKQVDEMKEIITAMEKQLELKMFDSEGMPSLYDITSAVDKALNSAPAKVEVLPVLDEKVETSNAYRSVIDLYTTEYPSGHVIFSVYDKQNSKYRNFRVDYKYDLVTKTATITGKPEEVLSSWIQERYMSQGKMDDDFIEKSGRMISSKNKTLLSDCRTKLQDAVSAIDSLIKVDEEDDEEKDFLEIIEKEADTIDIVDSVPEDSFEIDEEDIKKAVLNAMSQNKININVKGVAEEIMAKLKGRATI